MSISKIKSVFENIGTYDAWSLQLLKIKNSKKDGTSYFGREILLSPRGAITNFLSEISEKYCSQEKGIEKMFENVTKYDGSTISKTIYKLAADNSLIADEYSALIEAIGNPDVEIKPLQFSPQAYLLKGVISVGEDELSVKLISMQSPVTSLKHKFLHANGVFTQISDKVISLRTAIDVVIVDNTIYMLTLAGENLFNMERAYKSICKKQIENIASLGIINDVEAFSKSASSGHNPRKFVSFNEFRLQKLKNANIRKKMSEKFKIPLEGDKFDMNQPGAAEKLVKLLCDRGMLDPFDDNPMEVFGSKAWR